MRWLYLIFVLITTSQVVGQKKYQLSYESTGYQQFIKHPKTEFKDSISAQKYLRDLQSTAISKGYFLASVDRIEFFPKRSHVTFFLGPRMKNARIVVEPDELKFIRKHSNINEKLVTQLPFTPGEISRTLTRIRNVYLDNGYPFISIKLDQIRFEEDEFHAELVVNRGPFYKWTKLHIKGDSTVSENYLSSLIGVKAGDVFNESELPKISDRIQQVPFLEEIKVHEILFTKKGCELYVYLKNIPISSVNGIIGFQPSPTSDKLSITGDLNLKLLNVLHRGELLDVRWQSIRDQTQSLNAHLNYPFLFKTSFGIDGTFEMYKRDTSFLELKFTAGVQYFMNRGSYIKAFYENTSSNVLSGGQNNPLFSNLGSTRANSYGLSFHSQKLDYLPNPSRGTRITLTGSAGSRKSQLSDTSQSITSLIYRGNLDVEWFIPIARRHVIRLAGASELYSADAVFQNEVYRFGGLSSQRGFNEDELFATSRNTGTVEYRFLLDKNSHVFAFYDMTWYENNASNYYNDLPYGFGAGFSFSTKLGVFSISYALGKQFNNPILLSNSKVHFGYIAYF